MVYFIRSFIISTSIIYPKHNASSFLSLYKPKYNNIKQYKNNLI